MIQSPTPRYLDFDISASKDLVLPYELAGVSRMLRLEELRLLYVLARDWVRPGEQVIDAGAFLGSSAAALAAGLNASPDSSSLLKSVHSYDKFENTSDFYNRFLQGTVAKGGSFLPQFLHNTSAYSRYINVYPGDFLRFKWIGPPIGLLFCDIAKTPELDAHIWGEFVPYMQPGQSIFVQQDFVHIQAPFVHVALGALIDHFDVLAVSPPSLILGYRRRIEPAQLYNARRLQVSGTVFEQVASIQKLIDRCEVLDNDETTATLQLLKAILFSAAGLSGPAYDTLAEVRRRFNHLTDPYYLARLRSVQVRLGISCSEQVQDGGEIEALKNVDFIAD